MNLTLKDIENIQKQIDELKAKLEDKLELPSDGYALNGNGTLTMVTSYLTLYSKNGAIRETKELAEIASSRMIAANKLEAYASVLEPDYRWDNYSYHSIYINEGKYEGCVYHEEIIGVPKMSKDTVEKLCELLNNKEINL